MKKKTKTVTKSFPFFSLILNSTLVPFFFLLPTKKLKPTKNKSIIKKKKTKNNGTDSKTIKYTVKQQGDNAKQIY